MPTRVAIALVGEPVMAEPATDLEWALNRSSVDLLIGLEELNRGTGGFHPTGPDYPMAPGDLQEPEPIPLYFFGNINGPLDPAKPLRPTSRGSDSW